MDREQDQTLNRGLQVRVLEISGIDAEDEERWRDLASSSLEANATFDPDLLLPAYRHALQDTKVFLVVVTDSERFFGLLPVRIVTRWQRYPVKAFSSRLDDTPIPVLPVFGPPLVRAEGASETVRVLLLAISQLGRREGVDLLVFDRLNQTGPVAGLIRSACVSLGFPHRFFAHWDKPVLYRREGEDYRTNVLHRERMRDLAKKQRRLARSVGQPVIVRDRAGESDAVEDFLRIEASGWKGEQGTALGLDSRQTSFFRDSCHRLAQASKLHLLTLEAGGVPIAMIWCVNSGTGFFLLRIGHEARFGKFSPGGQLEVATAEFFQQSTGATMIDPCCAPTNAYHEHFLPDRLPIASSVIGIGRKEGRVLVSLLPLVTALRRGARAPVHVVRRAVTSSPISRSSR